MNNQSIERWFAIRTLTGQEITATDHLSQAGIEVWCPMFRTLTKPTKKRKPVEVNRPLLPGYTLATVRSGTWGIVRGCKGVIGWVAGPDGPLPCLRSAEITSMRERERLGTFDHSGLEGRLSKGDPLEVLFGPFAGWRVSFIAVTDNKIEGEVELLGATRRVLINSQHVKLAG